MPRKFTFYNRTKRPKLSYPENIEDYVDYTVHQEKKSTGPGVDDFEIIDVVEEHKVNINEFINSYNDKAGIDSVIRIFEATGDISVLHQVEPQFADLTIIPENPEEAFAATQSVQQAFEAIDPELISGQSMEDFIEGLTPEKLKAYIDKKVKEKLELEKKLKEKQEHENHETIK